MQLSDFISYSDYTNLFYSHMLHRLPAKPILRSNSTSQEQSSTRISSSESLVSSYEQLPPTDEPYYDMVAAEDEGLTQSESFLIPNILVNKYLSISCKYKVWPTICSVF